MSKHPYLPIVLGTVAGLIIALVLLSATNYSPQAERATEGPNLHRTRAESACSARGVGCTLSTTNRLSFVQYHCSCPRVTPWL